MEKLLSFLMIIVIRMIMEELKEGKEKCIDKPMLAQLLIFSSASRANKDVDDIIYLIFKYFPLVKTF